MFRAKSPAQECPICGTRHHIEATRCSQCGALLTGAPEYMVESTQPLRPPGSTGAMRPIQIEGPAPTRWEQGEADLYEGLLPVNATQLVLIVALVVIAFVALGAFLFVQSGGLSSITPPEPTTVALQSGSNQVTTATPLPPLAPLPTNTKVMIIPTISLPTVTPAPPTATLTPTQGPCMQTAQQGDTVYGMAARCGHKDLAVVDAILRLNNMTSANQLQIGQTLEIPWPTPMGSDTTPSDSLSQTTVASEGGSNVEPTLPPGVQWYTVKSGETALSIVFDLNITMKILQDLNPEIRFEQCDFSSPAGGPNCTVLLYENQRIRVPAPPPPPTVPPTLTGSETAVPTPTATFNAPISLSPDNRMLFETFDVPTLRWLSTGTLQNAETYMVIVTDKTTGATFYATTRELSFQLPTEWQPQDGTVHEYQWRVAIASVGTTQTPVPTAFTTETRTFTWRGR
ncbi:MAG: LysM peptidoglycan-binding domain-containing protein [Anaerolineae bacterium]|nr:LysM peptidoglycan-binding domain-containing protein [Anaerolineae bacterium]